MDVEDPAADEVEFFGMAIVSAALSGKASGADFEFVELLEEEVVGVRGFDDAGQDVSSSRRTSWRMSMA